MNADSSQLLPLLRVAVVDMQPITPAVGGGRLRLLGLYHNLGSGIDTTYVGTYDWPGERYREHRLTDSLLEVDVPLSAQHFRVDADWRAFAGGSTIIDVSFPILGHLSTEYVSRARDVVRAADVVIFAHPWVFPLLAGDVDRSRQFLVYDSQNAEALLKTDLLGEAPFNAEIAKSVAMAECFLVRAADLVLGCSKGDVEFFRTCYRVPADRFELVPNGVFINKIRPPIVADRLARRAALGLTGNVATFLGSDYGPNREAARFIVEALAPTHPEVTFAICGGVAHGWSGRTDLPGNVRVSGMLSDDEKLAWLHASDVALNPMFSGSGTNIKMFDYMAAGLPVVTTEVGARGITEKTQAGVFVCPAEAIGAQLLQLLDGYGERTESGRRNRKWVEADYAWEKLSPALGDKLRGRLTTYARVGEAVATYMPTRQLTESQDSGPPRHQIEQTRARIAILSTYSIRCGIAEYSSYLAEALLEEGAGVLVLGNAIEEPDGAFGAPSQPLADLEVARVWRYDQTTWTRSEVDKDGVLRLLRSRNITHFNVQYHQAFLPEPVLLDLLVASAAIIPSLSVTLHNSSGVSAEFVDVLRRLEVTVFVHNAAETVRLNAAGIRRTQYLPHGVRKSVASTAALAPSGELRPVLSTFGFLRPHKGLLELVSAIDILRRIFPAILLRAQTALYPSRDSSAHLDQVRARIAELHLHDHVAIDESFIPIDEAVGRLAQSDVVVLPYALSDEGSSAAAAAALAARRPIVVTKAQIFEEIRHAAYSAEDNSPAVLAVAIATVVSNQHLRAHLSSLASHAASDREWRAVARRFLELTAPSVDSQPQAVLAEEIAQSEHIAGLDTWHQPFSADACR